MRKLIFAINVTIDGCCDHTKGIAGEDIHEYFANLMQDAGLLLYGRKTYELMVPYWPDVAKNKSGETKAINDFAQTFTSVNKVVVSRSLENVEDKNTRIIRTNLHEEILKLKQEPGKNIFTGGVDLSSQLLQLGLIDEFYFVVQPVIAGEGRRLFDEKPLPSGLQLKLIDTKILPSGSVAHHYHA